VKEARQEAEELRSKWHKAIEHEKDSFLKELRLRASQQVHATVRKVLADLASEELEQRMIETFLGRLRALEQDDRKAIVESLRDSDHRVTIVSTFEISEEQRAQLREAVKRELVKSAEVKFETSRDSICGIVLKADGHQVAWEFEAYLRDLEEAVAGTLEGEMKAQPNSEKTDDGRSS
jgi:F-type H+-transporting ATPase subunit b